MRYWHFLKSEPIIFKLTLVQLLIFFGAWFTNVAIYTLLVQLGASSFVISITAAIHFLPAVIQAPFVGPLIDRIAPKPLMTVLLVIEILSTAMLLYIDSLDLVWLLMLLLFIRMNAASFYATAEMSILPKLLKGEALQTANELQSVIWSFSYTAGMAVSGIVVYYLGTNAAIIIDIFLFVVALILLLSLSLHIAVEKTGETMVEMIVGGIGYLRKNTHIIHLILLHAAVGFTAFDALVAVLADVMYKEVVAVPLAIGFINTIRSFALVIGAYFLGNWINDQRLVWLFIFQGCGIIIWGMLLENFYLSLVGSFITGLFGAIIWSYTMTMLQKRTDSVYFGRVIAYNNMAFMLTGVIVSLLIGQFYERAWTSEQILYFLGFCFLLTALYYFITLKKGLIPPVEGEGDSLQKT